ncbi:MAG: hypothetical protein JJU46_10055 [Balneolaceae bacterium]|nr:hypothetical protein [Balneolaceae bacterium]MCH8550262.1 hypothetical protein [Balneolaceae bacterium]
MKRFRKSLKIMLPVVALIMVLGLILSRVYTPEPSQEEPEATISATEAAEHTGKTMEVCGDVASADFIPSISGEPTFINFERPHPDQLFTAVIWGNNRSRWRSAPEELYINRTVCVTGRIEMHEGLPQIEATHPEQFRIR